MAQKKMTDLALRDEVTSDLNLPSDDGIQSYRVTAAQMKNFVLANQNILLAMLKDDIFNGLTSVSAADDDYFPLIDSSDSNKTKKALISTFVRNLYRNINNPSSSAILSTDGTVKITGTTGSVVLPTAVGIEGKRYKLIHMGTSLTQIYTINTTSSQTIGDIAAGDYKLHTFGEVLEVESDGANWIIMGRRTETEWSATATPVYRTSAASPLTMGTIVTNTIRWRRSGRNMIVQLYYRQSATATANVGSYGYKVDMPANAPLIDTAITGLNTTASGQDCFLSGLVPGAGGGSGGGGSLGGSYNCSVYDNASFRIAGSFGGIFTVLGHSLNIASGANAGWHVTGEFPMVGWQP